MIIWEEIPQETIDLEAPDVGSAKWLVEAISHELS